MSLDRLKWLTIVLPILVVACAQALTWFFLEPILGNQTGHLVAVGILAVGVVIFSTLVFRIIGDVHHRIVRHNEELTAINAVARAMSGSLDLQEALTHALANVMDVTGARAGEIVVEAEEPRERRLRLSQGAVEEIESLDGLWDSQNLSEEASPPAGEIRFVDLREAGAGPGPEAGASAKTFGSAAWVPLRAQNRVLGVMKLLAGEGSHLTPKSSERLLAAMASQIAISIQASHLFQDVLRRGKESQALYEIGLRITSLQDVQQILRSIVEYAREMLDSEVAALCLSGGNGGGLILAGRSGPEAAFRRQPIRVPPFPAGVASGPANPAPGGQASPCPALAEGYAAYHLSLPLLVGNSIIGELCVSGRKPLELSERQQELLASLADMATIAINNARLLEGERQLAVLEERERLAREMHDSLAQVLAYLHLKALATRDTLAKKDTKRTAQELNDMATLAHEAYVDVREAILGLSQSVSATAGIVDTLNEYLQKFSRQSGINVEIELGEYGDAGPHFPPEVEVQLIRVIQEALTNVRKHANAKTARVRMAPQDGDICITISDDGNGFDPSLIHHAGGRRFGVRIMRQRIERVGGSFEIESNPGRGTRVHIRFPLAEGRER